MSLRVTSSVSILALVGVIGCASAPPPPTHPSPLLGYPMPSFESRTISGNPVISGAYQGHTVVVSFVASKCRSCEKTLTAAQSVYADNRDLVVVGVFQQDRAEGAIPLAARLALHFPVVVDHDGVISRRFQIGDVVPSTFVVDGMGRVRWVGGSELTADGLDRAVQAAQ